MEILGILNTASYGMTQKCCNYIKLLFCHDNC